MSSQQRYSTNLELFSRDNPLGLNFNVPPILKFCQTLENEPNLVNETCYKYLLSQRGAFTEAKKWANSLYLESCDVIFVFGLGLGYYYLPLQDWLQKNPDHHLVFLEDNPEIIHHFLETELATQLLESKQVIIRKIPKIEPNEEGWAKLRAEEAEIFDAFAFSKPIISVLQAYFYQRLDFYQSFSLQWLTNLARSARSLAEFYPLNPQIFHNFYANLRYLDQTIPGYKLANAMHSIPAILCGAGPSLPKQLALLKTITDQFFVMGSGSAMNALTQASIIPHVGGAIDPTVVQASRQLTSFGFNVPAFYQNRFYGKALEQWHGPLLHMPGCGAYRVSEWFEKELGIVDAVQIIQGVSTSNFLLEIANFLGCNPIIFIGMDLAYTDDKRYAAGVSVHVKDGAKRQDELERKQDNLISIPGAEGNPVLTNNQWFYEAVCIGAFKQRNPQLICLNATEGGMAIPEVQNISFKNAIQAALDAPSKAPLDIEGWFHGNIQNASVDRIKKEKITTALNKWKKSLKTCVHVLEILIRMQSEQMTQVSELLEKLYLEPAYKYLLDVLNTEFDKLNLLRVRKQKWITDDHERKVEQASIEIDRFVFLRTYASDHLKSLVEAKSAFRQRELALSTRVEQSERLAEPPEVSAAKSEGDFSYYYYPGGEVKTEAQVIEGKLHGTWTFYSLEGRVFYRSIYVAGKKQGTSYSFYPDGALFNQMEHFEGILEGMQRHYYADGTLKTIEHYDKGVLHGLVRLYYSNGRLKKEQFFVRGRLQGKERLWDERGELWMETDFDCCV